jgi:hypothetical protein
MEALMEGYKDTSPARSHATPEVRAARAAGVFAAIWLALAVGSPLIVRYAPSADDHAMAALVTRMETPRCVATPDHGCPGRTVLAVQAAAAGEPDL